MCIGICLKLQADLILETVVEMRQLMKAGRQQSHLIRYNAELAFLRFTRPASHTNDVTSFQLLINSVKRLLRFIQPV